MARDLVKVYGRGEKAVRALDGVSLELAPGTVLGLLGPNGAGKTTTVSVLTTLTRPDSGSAHVNGIDVARDPAAVRRSIGLAGQYAAVDENLTGAENLELVGRLNHLGRSRARERARVLLDRFGLADAGGRRAKTYSGGMRRRLDLAAALVAEPPVLFLDEPTTGLDPRSRVELWGVIEQLVADGTTLLLTTQYLEEADRLAGTISVVDHGQVIAEGTPAELKARLGATVVEVGLPDEAAAGRAVQVAERLLAGGPAGDGGAAGRVSRDGSLLRVPTVQGPALLVRLLGALGDEDLIPTSVAVREPSLDDVFLSLTGQQLGGTASGDQDAGESGADRPDDHREGRSGSARHARSAGATEEDA